jgi:hypothetical protein
MIRVLQSCALCPEARQGPFCRGSHEVSCARSACPIGRGKQEETREHRRKTSDHQGYNDCRSRSPRYARSPPREDIREVKRLSRATESGDDVGLVSNLGLDIIGQVVGVVAREVLAARHGLLGVSGPHLLDAVLVVGVNDGRDIEVGEAHPASEEKLAKHAGLVLRALGDSVEVALVVLGELNGGVLSGADGDRLDLSAAGGRSEDNLASSVIKSLESDGSSVDSGGSGSKAEERSSEMHLEVLFGGSDCGSLV